MQKQLTLLIVILTFNSIFSQDYFPTNDGIKFDNTNYTAFINAKIYSSHNNIIENGSMVIKDGKIVSIGEFLEIPKNSIIFDLKGKSVTRHSLIFTQNLELNLQKEVLAEEDLHNITTLERVIIGMIILGQNKMQ